MTATKHICRTSECWTEHAENPDGTSRCLWSSRDGRTPTKRMNYGAKWSCGLPSRSHMWRLDATPHEFTLSYQPKVNLDWHTFRIVAVTGATAGALVSVVLAIVGAR